MSRFIKTELVPAPLLEVPAGFLLVAPNSVRVRGLSAQSLYQIGKASLKKRGFGIATPMLAADALRTAVRTVLPHVDASSVARHYREIIAEILRSGICTDKLAASGSERAHDAALIADSYRAILQDARLIDSDAVLAEAVRPNVIEPRSVLVYGYFRGRQLPARPEEIEFIDRLAGDGSIFYLPSCDAPMFSANREWIELLKLRGWEVLDPESRSNEFSAIQSAAIRFSQGTDSDAETNPDRFEAIEYPSLESEVRGSLARAKSAAIDGVALGRIAVVCRDLGSYSRPLISTALEYRLPIDLVYEVSVSETPFGEFISLIFETLDVRTAEEIAAGVGRDRYGFSYESTLRLLLHRFGPGVSEDSRASAYKTRPSSYDRWRELTEEIEPLYISGERSQTEWAQWLRNTLGRWNIRGKEKLGGSATDVEAYDRFFESLEQLARGRGGAPIGISSFAVDVSDVLFNVSTPLHTASGGIKIRQPNEIVGQEFERLFVLGLAEGILPTPANDSSVIDFCEREKLRKTGIHFEDAHEVPRWEALTFYFSLLSCTGKISFSYPKFVGETELLASSYFKRLGIEPRPSTEQFVSSVPEYRQAYLRHSSRNHDAILNAARHQHAIESRRESTEPPDEYDGVVGVPVSKPYWSASSLSRIGSCPFKWFANDVLRLNEPEEADAELRGDMRGRLYHKALELAVKRARGTVDLRTSVLEILEEEFGKAEILEEKLPHVANWELRRGEHLETLRFAVSSDQFMYGGASVVDTERSFEAEYCGLKIKGKIDRVDRLKNGELLAIDYKSGNYIAKIKDDDGLLKIDIQLPIYSRIGAPKLYPNETCAGGAIYHLADPKITRGKDVDLDRVLLRIKKLLDDGRFAVDPDVKQDACTFCEYDVVCRRGPRLMRKRAAVAK